MNFQLRALAHDQFQHYYGLSDEVLCEQKVIAYIADAETGYPCRVTLKNAQLGDRLLLINYTHHNVDNPYHGSHAIFVIDGAHSCVFSINEVPELITQYYLSIRAFGNNDLMIDADTVQGQKVSQSIKQMFANHEVSYLHIHTAKRGCFLAKVIRSD